jgi:hypothetical protein
LRQLSLPPDSARPIQSLTRCCDSRVTGGSERETIEKQQRLKKQSSVIELPAQYGRISFTLAV